MRVDFKPEGQINAAVEKLYMDRLETAAGYVAGYARSNCPVGEDKYSRGMLIHRKGALRRTIRVVRLEGDPKLNIFIIAGKAGIVDYAASVEYGGVHNKPAQPFLRPAPRAMKSRIMSIMNGGE